MNVRAPWLALAFWFAGSSICLAQSSAELLEQGSRLLERRDFDAARPLFERALAQAREERAAPAEGSAHFGLGKVFLGKARYPEARAELEQALAIFQAASDRARTGRVFKDLGFVAWAQGNRLEAGALYRKALIDFEAVGDQHERASTLYNLTFMLPPGDEKREGIQQGLDLVRALGNRRLEGLLLHLLGDTDFAEGDYAAAAERLDQAATLLEQEGARAQLARVFTSLGRLFRSHDHPDRSLEFYRRAVKIQEELQDQQGVIQSIDAMAIAFHSKGDDKQALEYFGRGLALARQTGSPAIIGRQLVHLASFHNDLGEYAKAVGLIEEAGREDKPLSSRAFHDLSLAYSGLGRYQDALAAAEKATELGRFPSAGPEALTDALVRRARVKEKLGRASEALADAQEALREFERLRARSIPTDFMRSGFSSTRQALVAYVIDLLFSAGQYERALEAAEHGRARAFLDLLATRDLEPRRADRAQIAALRDVERGLQENGVDPADVSVAAAPTSVLRGADSNTAALWQQWQRAGSDVKSLVSAPPFSAAQATAAAARLRSTVVAYWVGPAATYIWVVNPGQPVRATRVSVSADHLRQWLSATTQAGDLGRDLVGREGRAVDAGAKAREPWRRLYDVLIGPIRPWLPVTQGSRLTFVPHGPLFTLSFAALVDEKGLYLVERYALHSVPAAGVLEFTQKRKLEAAGRQARYLLVADPSGPPASPDGRVLARLPGTLREVRDIARQVPAGSATVLTGDQALEATVRALAPDKTVIHFATHGIVRDDQPFDSFLALAGRGRLTAQRIYGLDLSADLVVLSGCRTGLGKISGDGIVGLTRAFFYAGTPSVVATLWEVADEPTSLLVAEFYRSLRRTGDKALALRDAQLRLLRALRRGDVRVTTPAGTFTLPEHPLFWAGFTLQGEP